MSLTALHEQALQLILLNPGNACYMNALIQVMVWLVTIDTLSVTSLASATGRFYLSLLHNSRLGPINLLHDPRWLSRIEGWAEVHRQHDVCEFFTFLMQGCDCGIFTGSWQARMPTAAGNMRLVDAGLCTQPIVLYIPQKVRHAAAPRLQSLVADWHRCVDRFHGLEVAPPVLALQLHRFQQQRGAVVKNHGKALLDDVIRVPIFRGRGSCTVQHQPYTLTAFIEHHGDTLTSGNYTATLVQENFWRCDDGRIAQARRALTDQQLRNCYVLFYQIRDTPPGLESC